jgi:GNAT superfamily N-acetyltransferase
VAYTDPESLSKRHRVEDFDCGEPELDEWLKRHALQAESSGSAKVFVTTEDGEAVVGYYALATAQVECESAPPRVLKGQARRPVPAILLARLAVDRGHQRRGVGSSLLKDAMLRCMQASEAVGVRVLLVHAKHDEARAWYEQYGFEPSQTDPLHLMLLIKDLKAFVEGRL